MWRFLRRIALLSAAVGLVAAARAVLGARVGLAIALTLAGCGVLVGVILPRVAHRAFGRGAFTRAALLYRFLMFVRQDGSARAALGVSIAACLIGRERHRDALALLDRVDRTRLEESAHAAWHNNRAYALVRGGRDPAEALVEVERAVALRPDPAGFRHTHAVVLLAVGRIDEAIRQLDAVWRDRGPTDGPPLLEAERCHDLGVAWEQKGEAAYAADYFERACRAAPGSPWAVRAAARLGARDALPSAFADLV